MGVGRIFHGNSTWARPHSSWLLYVQWVPTGGEGKGGCEGVREGRERRKEEWCHVTPF